MILNSIFTLSKFFSNIQKNYELCRKNTVHIFDVSQMIAFIWVLHAFCLYFSHYKINKKSPWFFLMAVFYRDLDTNRQVTWGLQDDHLTPNGDGVVSLFNNNSCSNNIQSTILFTFTVVIVISFRDKTCFNDWLITSSKPHYIQRVNHIICLT